MSNKTKHTPGPWKFEGGRYGNDKVEVIAKDARGVVTHLVAAVVAYKPSRGPDGKWRGDLLTEEGVANAHLIAAAPGLLAALKRLRDANRMRNDHEAELWDVANDAIARAEGSRS